MDTKDERSLILEAIHNKKKVKSEPVSECAIGKMVKRKIKQESFRQKLCREWSNIDFLRYLDFMLKDFGTTRNVGNACRDSDYLNKIYDQLAKKLQHKMTNVVLRNYMEWWCSIWAPRMTGSGVWLLSMIGAPVEKFLSRYDTEKGPNETNDNMSTQVTDEAIFDLGGLPMLLVKRGIVISRRKSSSENIGKTLSSFQGSMLGKIIEATLQYAPYSDAPWDFILLAHPFLVKHGLTSFLDVDYRCCFKEL